MGTMDITETKTPAPADVDIFAFLDGAEYPTRELTLYTDTAAAAKLRDLKTANASGTAEEQGKLTQRVKDSALVFTLQGLEPGEVSDLYDEDANPDLTAETQLHTLAARSIVKVVTGTGAAVNTVWTADTIKALRRKLNIGEFAKLVEAVSDVNFDAALFDDAVDAGFPGGRADEATE